MFLQFPGLRIAYIRFTDMYLWCFIDGQGCRDVILNDEYGLL